MKAMKNQLILLMFCAAACSAHAMRYGSGAAREGSLARAASRGAPMSFDPILLKKAGEVGPSGYNAPAEYLMKLTENNIPPKVLNAISVDQVNTLLKAPDRTNHMWKAKAGDMVGVQVESAEMGVGAVFRNGGDFLGFTNQLTGPVKLGKGSALRDVMIHTDARRGDALTSLLKDTILKSPERVEIPTVGADGTKILRVEAPDLGVGVNLRNGNEFKGFFGVAEKGPVGLTRTVSGSRIQANPINPGPLPRKVADTFRGGTYEIVKLDQPLTLYRVYSDPAKKLGPFWSLEKPQSSIKAIVDNALDPNWKNRATNIVSIQVPAGSTVYVGPAASQRALVGGKIQVYLDSPVSPAWEVK